MTARRLLLPLALLGLAACSPLRENEARPAQDGEACDEDIDCGAGLVCAFDGTCTFSGQPGTAGLDEPCTGDDDCRTGLLCNGVGLCGRQRKGDIGDRCFADSSCRDGLVCDHDGACANPGTSGTGETGSACGDDADCGFGLVCDPEDRCAPLPRWSGVSCPDNADGAPRVLFQVPRGTPNDAFFQLPFPNDAALRGDLADLSGFPGLDHQPVPGSLLGRYASAVEAEVEGFSPNAAALLRFSGALDFETLRFGGDAPTFLFVDVTPGSDARGRQPRSRFFATTDRGRYICNHWLGIRPSEGSPLEPGHTYAVLFRRGLTDSNGVALEPAPDFAALLGETPPTHPALANAWERYGALRSWLSEEGIPAEDVVGGTLFTVGDPAARLAGVRDAVQAAPAPALRDLTLCDGGTDSPCEGGGERTCGDVNPLFAEYHAVAELPSFLRGVPPYDTWGGDAVLRGGRPRVQRREDVCVSLAIPRADPPAGGWPVVLFAPDVDGHFRTPITRGLVNRLTMMGWAVVSFDGVLHGTRFSPERLPEPGEVAARLYDLERTGLLRDQALQGVADLHAMVRLLDDVEAPGGGRFHASDRVFFGHGRGAEIGVPFLAHEPAVRAAVLANGGGGIVDWLRMTRAPVNLGARIGLALADDGLNGMHAGLHLLQTWLDPRDPINYGRFLRSPPEGVPAKHVLLIHGTADSVTPANPMAHLAVATRVERVGAEIEPLEAVSAVEQAPARGNVRTRDGVRTQVVKMYAPEDGADGHDVVFDHRGTINDLNRFFRTLREDPEGIPTVGAD